MPNTDGPTDPPPVTEPPGPPPVDIEIDAGALQPGCEPLHPDCLLPFPSNVYTVADSAASTGLQISFTAPRVRLGIDGYKSIEAKRALLSPTIGVAPGEHRSLCRTLLGFEARY